VTEPTIPVSIALLDAAEARLITNEIERIYHDAFSVSPWTKTAGSIRNFATEVFPRHLAHDGFELATARDGDGKLVGFCYGFIGNHGQYWTDYVAARIHPSLEKEWLGGHFEITELAVDEASRDRGIGRALLTTLLESRGDDRMALQTIVQASPARSLYESMGFTPFGEFEDFVVLGLRRS
jgi:ribosomal protein S18 acetylase RimI-like enzyme